MRHLNKIIFINSANIPYAQVQLDGNVHFAGTQGVGKSTVLRAILFFYTADKMHLGIQPGQRTFEEFYFPKSNSYIIYEVATDRSAYTIMLSRSQGKAVFRFIDAPYSKDWFIGPDNRAESDWIRIRSHIGDRIEISAKIDTYELYRNIIFGNTRDTSHRYDKYALVESRKYQNIPRSIQNVFLNSKLDADFVKNTIIQSMTDIEDAVNLTPYRSLLTDFEREFEEIGCWYRKDPTGEVSVRVKANKVIDCNNRLRAAEHELRLTWRRLNYAVENTREQLPHISDEIGAIRLAINTLVEKLERLQTDFNEEHEAIISKIAVYKSKLADIRKKRKYYADIDIQSIIDFEARRPIFEKDKEQKTKQLAALQGQYSDIAEKYKRLRETLAGELTALERAHTEALQRLRDEIQARRDELSARRDATKAAIDSEYNKSLAESDERFDNLQAEHSRADKRLVELKYWHPRRDDIARCNDDIAKLTADEKDCRSRLTVVQTRLETIRKEVNLKREQIEKDYLRAAASLRAEIDELKGQLADVNKILHNWNGSLYQWLVQNKPGWEANIGKVVDEQNVLYASGLNPSLAEGTGFFGLNIDLDAIDTHHRTPDDYRAMQKTLSEAIEVKGAEAKDLEAAKVAEIAAVEKTAKAQLSENQEQESLLNYQLNQIPLKRKDLQTKLRELQQIENQLIKAEEEKRKEVLAQAILNVEAEKNKRGQILFDRDRKLKKAEAAYNSAIKEDKKRLDELKTQQTQEHKAKADDIAGRRKDLDRRESDELKGKGADTAAIELCRKAIAAIDAQLDKIDKQLHFVIEYKKDQDDLLCHEDEYKNEKQRLEDKDAAIRQKFEDKRRRLESEKKEHNANLIAKNEMLGRMNEGLRQYEQLCKVEQSIPDYLLDDDTPEKNATPCTELVSLMRGALNRKAAIQVELKRAVNNFFTHFSADNIFKFVAPQNDDDFPIFAVALQEFVDDNRIEDYRERVSDHYNDILRNISREFGMLMNHSAEIKGIINDINRDFRERNFAGVIRSIELQAEESSDRLMQLLNSIHNFTKENEFSFGQANLFSGDDRDQVNLKVVEYIRRFMTQLNKEPARAELNLSDTFRLQFRVQENDNNTGWVERINNVGSDGTDILVKAMVNIMLINVFKSKAARKNGDFIIHCMMDEIGKLHPSNVAGILQFANVRNIYLINSSPMGYNADIYKYNYLLTKDQKARTRITRLLTVNNI